MQTQIIANRVEDMPESFLVICLCAEWCATCREYREGFDSLAPEFPEARFRWLDIEEHADDMGDLDVENFPTLLILRHGSVVFFGTMLPHLSHLRRSLQIFSEQTPEQSRAYACASPERRIWQENTDLHHLAELSDND